MKTGKSSILTRLTLAVGLLLALSACTSDIGPDPVVNDNKIILNLDVRIDNGSSAVLLDNNGLTRADDWYFEAPANKYEGVKTLRIIIYRKAQGTVEYNRLINIPEDQQLQSVIGPQQFKVEGGELKGIYLIANEESLSAENVRTLKKFDAGSSFDPVVVAAMLVSAPGGNPIVDNESTSTPKYLPMSECFDCTVIRPTQENIYQDETFFITRAGVKFSFEIDPSSYVLADGKNLNSFIVSEITVSGIAESEYLLPYNTSYNPIKEEAADGRIITDYECPADVTTTTIAFHPRNFGQNRDADRESDSDDAPYQPTAYASTYAPMKYFCESPVSASGYSVGIKVRETGDSEDIDLGTVLLPNLPSLPRNTHVRVIMTFREHTLECAATLMPYIAVWLYPEFGL
ncbi:MAG: hypothetical protein NC328_00525 [Muribaculum sp.]|nr:hypothetical protein [Muribaculum sp.]